ncbi:MAG: crossover junction endodeoxyribonuclease RuvC [Candidatus Omnitrophica bacterium]|nr:crossover junction endodeoxyribonuclease RuvC [Candidatus Omnitrophota bacterium]
MRILGIDPGLDATGYGLIEVNGTQKARLVEAGLIRTKTGNPLPHRLAAVARELQIILTQHRPDFMAVEDLYSYYKTPKPAILMGHVRGVLLSTAALAKIPVRSYLPTRIKKAVVGKGHAPKLQIARMVQMRLGLNGGQVPADVTDALAVALCHLDTVKGWGWRGND